MNTALTIAGSDSIGGAGIQADIKTMTLNGVYAMSVITAVTAQNTLSVDGIYEVSEDFIKSQLDAVFRDIFPDAVKIGMVSSEKAVYAISDRLKFYNAQNIVTDPVMIATSGANLIKSEAIKVLEKEIFPVSYLITPNIYEAEVLAKDNINKISDKNDMEYAAKLLGQKYGCNILLKGGHGNFDTAEDVLYDYKTEEVNWFKSPKIHTDNTHGTGCTLSSAIAANLAKGCDLKTAVETAKEYIFKAIWAGLNLGKGNGPIMHNFILNK